VTRAARLAVLLLVACGGGPLGPFHDGRLSGEPASAPVADWSFANERSTLALEIDPDAPYSVNVYFVAEGPNLWTATILRGASEWAARLAADGRARVRVGAVIYPCRAVRVSDAAEADHVAALYRAKYAITPDVGSDSRAIVFRLESQP
jgi:hypothetical protein